MPHTIPPKDLFGLRFGRLVVARRAQRIGRKQYWLCACECGTMKHIRQDALTGGRSKSCGCASPALKAARSATLTVHGHARKGKISRTYRIWRAMRERCRYPKHHAYHRYGGRGIKVCQRWMDFSNFLSDMGEAPDGLTLERKDRDGNYDPSNCIWATMLEQSNNTSRNRFLEHNGERRTVAQWAVHTGLRSQTILSRVSAGWATGRALTQPLRG